MFDVQKPCSLSLDDRVLKQSILDHIAFLFNQFPVNYLHLHKLVKTIAEIVNKNFEIIVPL